MDNDHGRDEQGRFATGNPGGPGRPRRAIEREYLATITEACPPDAWTDIVRRAVDDAKAGDAKAREWLSRFLVGTDPESLKSIAAKEHRGLSAADEVGEVAARQEKEIRRRAKIDAMLGNL